MSLYVDSSSLLKLYLREPDSDSVEGLLRDAGPLITGRHTEIEVRRNLARRLTDGPAQQAKAQFRRDWESISIVELDEITCAVAAEISENTGARTLDALHLGAAQRSGEGALSFMTHDLRQARTARSLGWTVLGAPQE
jgi:uncharacterized protein